jgi:hypothetical protein
MLESIESVLGFERQTSDSGESDLWSQLFIIAESLSALPTLTHPSSTLSV